ncbi:hypothetical protein [Corynebacterium sp. sy039]|uniref:hypothetical protein n=1 Tax=Corynebacterium sp. sy039 TaxID=2599641 RepID=UPI0011B74EE1|nr:hypothetical protein [Corynebacterium sp. sy039]QDZ42291.1 hypothetical protein FQV43_03270 [Corynebacterium sp. sy039]
MSNRLVRGLVAGVAGLTLSAGLVACSGEDAQKAKDAAVSVKNEAGDSADNALDKAKEAGSNAVSEVKEAGAKATEAAGSAVDSAKEAMETKEVKLSDGSTVEVPDALADAAHEADEAVAYEEGEDGTYSIELSDGTFAVYNAEGKVVPVIGKIAETWKAEGGLKSSVGAPLAAEETVENGWNQKFAHGSIDWVDEGNGFGPKINNS